MNEERLHRPAECWCGHSDSLHFGAGSSAVVCRECGAPSVDTELPMLAERRRFERFGIPHPIRTSVGSSPAYVVDASIAGIGVLHHQPAPGVGSSCRLMFYSEFGPITLQCEIVRTTPAIDQATFQSGMRILAADSESEARLRMLVMSLAVPATQRPNSH